MEVMTPQEARQLLDGIPHDEWKFEEYCEPNLVPPNQQVESFSIEQSVSVGGEVIFGLYNDPLSIRYPKLAESVASVPELVRTVAGLREEYMIQVELPDVDGEPWWVTITSDGGNSAVYQTAEAAEQDRQKALELYGALRTRIVRRYVSEPEEVQL